ncbi:histidine phosphatase family protein [Alphaproteobacteria bacterium]|jgi:alpha-ribazole phosphatase|nr:histidine phosphatase family protein [Alphaproteobacteria bacterium]NCF49674.1 hypothetical protein [Bacteroidota bacterium]
MSEHPDICEFYFVRHAPVVKQSGHVPPSDPPIQKQEYATERLIQHLPHNADWHVSPLRRARETEALLVPSLAPASRTICDALKEMDFGDWHDAPIGEVWSQIAKGPLHNWSFVGPDTQPPAGESFATMAKRVQRWMDSRAADFPALPPSPDSNAISRPRPQIIIAHGGVMRAAMAYAMGASLSQVVGIPIAHFGLMRLSLMDPDSLIESEQANGAGGGWLFGGLADLG